MSDQTRKFRRLPSVIEALDSGPAALGSAPDTLTIGGIEHRWSDDGFMERRWDAGLDREWRVALYTSVAPEDAEAYAEFCRKRPPRLRNAPTDATGAEGDPSKTANPAPSRALGGDRGEVAARAASMSDDMLAEHTRLLANDLAWLEAYGPDERYGPGLRAAIATLRAERACRDALSTDATEHASLAARPTETE